MKKNAGVFDRGFRILFGLALLSLAFFGPQTAWGYVGFVPLLTGVAGFCPLYTLFGFNTCPIESKR